MRINKFGNVTVEDLGEKKFKLVFRDYKNYPQIQYGLLEEAMETLGYKGKVTMHVGKMKKLGPGDIIADFEFIIEWE